MNLPDAALDAIAARHVRSENGVWCDGCTSGMAQDYYVPWPCDAVTLLAALRAARAATAAPESNEGGS